MKAFNYSETVDTLKKVNSNSYWGWGIKDVLADPTPDKVKEIVKEMRSQAKDCPEVMLDILGEEVFSKII